MPELPTGKGRRLFFRFGTGKGCAQQTPGLDKKISGSRQWSPAVDSFAREGRVQPDPDAAQPVCRILLADDHKLLMEGVRSLLAPYAHLRVAGMAQNGSEAVALAASLVPHIIIMDLGMPGMNGVEASRAVLQILPETRILVYTGHEDQRFLPELVELGIMGHVRKSESPGVLLKAIESLRRGEIFLTCPDPGGCLSAMLRARLAARRDGAPDIGVLSPREKEIFRLLADGKSVKSIAQHLYISPKTVESHKYNILTKLKAGSVGELVKIAIRYGLLQI